MMSQLARVQQLASTWLSAPPEDVPSRQQAEVLRGFERLPLFANEVRV